MGGLRAAAGLPALAHAALRWSEALGASPNQWRAMIGQAAGSKSSGVEETCFLGPVRLSLGKSKPSAKTLLESRPSPLGGFRLFGPMAQAALPRIKASRASLL